MRKAMVNSVSNFIEKGENTALFLVDIGVWAFRNILEKYPERALNIGIFEDGMISVAAGLALQGITPTIYGITPFIIERAFEQLKLDFSYQNVGGNFITTGASYDFSTLGYSHYCPGDIQLLRTLPDFEIITPGCAEEFVRLFEETKNNGRATYFRLSDYANSTKVQVEFGKAAVIKEGTKATVIAISTTLDMVLAACSDMDVTILYYSTIAPFDGETLRNYEKTGKILLCEPFFEGTMYYDVIHALEGKKVLLDTVGIPREIIRGYGTKSEKDIKLGLTSEKVKEKLTKLIEL